ncbi:MAG: IPT/TIG domain-containing protein [Bryobacteraceae bacterium]
MAPLLGQPAIVRFDGSGADTLQAIAATQDGDVVAALTTTSADLPVRGAAARGYGESNAMRSVDGGVSWRTSPMLPALRPRAIATHPTDSRVLIAVAEDGIYKSVDAGGTWRQASKLTRVGGDARLAVDPEDSRKIYAAVGSPMLSIDGGDSWRAISDSAFRVSPVAVNRVVTGPAGTVLFYPEFGAPVISRDGGVTWAPLMTPDFFSIATLDPRNAGWIYISTGVGVNGQLYLSRNGGASWDALPWIGERVESLEINPDRSQEIWVSTAGDVRHSIDGGKTWTRIGGQRPFVGTRRLFRTPTTCSGGVLFSITLTGDLFRWNEARDVFEPAGFGGVSGIAAAPDCTIHAVRELTEDAWVTRLEPGGTPRWSTYVGGFGKDQVRALALARDGSVALAGVTGSGELAGIGGVARVFVAKLDPDGRVSWVARLGGTELDDVAAVTVDAAGAVYVAGAAQSKDFPVTPGTFGQSPRTGWAAKLSPEGKIEWATYVARSETEFWAPTSIAVTSKGELLLAAEGYAARIDGAGERFTLLDPQVLPRATRVAVDREDNVYFAGLSSLTMIAPMPGVFSTPYRSISCQAPPGSIATQSTPIDAVLTKLAAGTLSLIWSTVLTGECATAPTALTISNEGDVIVSFRTDGTAFPQRNIVATPGLCTGGVVARLNASASDLLFSSYLDTCVAPAVAAGTDGAIYVGAADLERARVMRVAAPSRGPVAIDRVGVAFGGYSQGIAPGALVSIGGEGLGPRDAVDLGLNARQRLPLELEGTRVWFGDEAAPLMAVSDSQIVCVAPAGITDRVTVHVERNGVLSNSVLAGVRSRVPHLLPASFPNASALPVPGNVRNEDGAANDLEHPARQGSFVSVYATGLGQTRLEEPPGSISAGGVVQITPAIYAPWAQRTEISEARALPGFIAGLYEIRLRVPPLAPSGASPMALPLFLAPDSGGRLALLRFVTPGNTILVYVTQ